LLGCVRRTLDGQRDAFQRADPDCAAPEGRAQGRGTESARKCGRRAQIRRLRAMTKADLVDIVADKTGLTKRDVAQVVEELLEAIKVSLAEHRHIEIREFGTFKVKRRKASMKYNPRDRSQKVVVPEKLVPVFKPSKFLKERVNWEGRSKAAEAERRPETESSTSEEAHV
jgi:nucleoid DNA-binding protein